MIALGLAIALAAVFIFPEHFGPQNRVVAVREEPKAAPNEIRTSSLQTGPVSYAEAVAKAAPAVVNVATAKEIVKESHPLLEDPLFNPFFRDPVFGPSMEQQTSLGSGVIINPQGYILTNNHVIAGADEIKVILSSGERVEVRVIGVDPETDVAVLKANPGNMELPSVVIRSSELRVGDVVLAIGNPFSIGQTVTQGIISAKGRSKLGLNTIEDFIQTDAAINPGSSGGALIDAHGQLVGINTAIFSQSGSTGIGFAIPANLARDVMTQIIEHGQVIRGWLGVEGSDIPAQIKPALNLEDNQGVLITYVLPDGPAAVAGLRENDILVSLNGEPAEGVKDALHIIAQSTPGSKMLIEGIRDQEPFTVEAIVSIRPFNPDG